MNYITSLSQYNKTWAINHLMGVEGGEKFTDIKADKGGKTRYGITEGKALEHKDAWPKFNFNGDMRVLPPEFAFYIYDTDYWTPLKLDAIAAMHPLIADCLLDIGCNRGVGSAGTYLQRLLNVFNVKGTLYPDIKVDGSVGPGTIGAINNFVAKRGFQAKKALILGLLSLQNTSYIGIAEKDPTQEEFSMGWSNRVTDRYEVILPLLKTPF
jgi:lysozyme family protein